MPIEAPEGIVFQLTPPSDGGITSREALVDANRDDLVAVSKTKIETVDLLSEGEIQGLLTGKWIKSGTLGNVGWTSAYITGYTIPNGYSNIEYLKSIYYNEVPILNDRGEFNFQNVDIAYSYGTPSGKVLQTLSPLQTTSRVIGERLYANSINKKTYRILNTDCRGVIVNMKIASMFKNIVNSSSNNNLVMGDTDRVTMQYNISYRPIFSSESPTEFITPQRGKRNLFGKITTSPYIDSVRIDFPTNYSPMDRNFIGWEIQIEKITPESISTTEAYILYIDSITELGNNLYTYPNSAMVKSSFDAEYFSNIPERAFETELLKVKVPGNYDVRLKTYSTSGFATSNGGWDGTFATGKQWTDNPAWCFYDLITNKRYGLGKYINEDEVDKWTLYDIGKYCDTLVSDGEGGLEPRFSCNVWITQREEAYKVVNDLASVFRGLTYYANGLIYAVQDSPKDPIFVFTNANVENGDFNYSSTSRKDRHSVAVVRYNDPKNFYRPAIEYVEDFDSVLRYGIREVEMTAFGCTSRGQAIRLGRWALISDNTETETVSFTAGLEVASHLKPGDVFKVSDANKKTRRHGGRTISINNQSGISVSGGTYQSGYSYPFWLGSNNRSGLLGLNSDLTFNALTNMTGLINGNNTENYTYFNDGQDILNKNISFDFKVPTIVNEAKWYQDTTAIHGEALTGSWKWFGSNDNSGWTQLSDYFRLGGATPYQTITGMHKNLTAYRYYSLSGVATGKTTSNPFLREIEFQIVEPASISYGYNGSSSYEDIICSGNRSGIINIFTNLTNVNLAGGNGNISGLINGGFETGIIAFNQQSILGKHIYFDLGSQYIVNGAKWYQNYGGFANSVENTHGEQTTGSWRWFVSNDKSNWKAIGNNFIIGNTATGLLTGLNNNVTAYRYYCISGVGTGNTSASPWIQEIELKSPIYVYTGATVTLDSTVALDSGVNFVFSILTPSYNYIPSVSDLNSNDTSNIRRPFIQKIQFSGAQSFNTGDYTAIRFNTGFDERNYYIGGRNIWALEVADSDINTYTGVKYFTNYSDDYFRVINIRESDIHRYEVLGLQYNKNKFIDIESGLSYTRDILGINAIPASPSSSINFNIQANSPEAIQYYFMADEKDANTTAYHVYVKSGSNFVGNSVPGDNYLVDVLPPQTKQGIFIPDSSGDYYFRIYSSNISSKQFSPSFATGFTSIKTERPIKYINVSSLQLISKTGQSPATSEGVHVIKSNDSNPSFDWQVGSDNYFSNYDDVYYRLTLRPVQDNSFSFFPATGFFYEVTGLTVNNWTFDLNTNISLAGGPYRNYQVVVEAHDSQGYTSAGNRIGYNEAGQWNNYINNFDTLVVYNPRATGIELTNNLLTEYKENSGYSAIYKANNFTGYSLYSGNSYQFISKYTGNYLSNQFIGMNGEVTLNFASGTFDSDLIGGYIYISTGRFPKLDAAINTGHWGVAVNKTKFDFNPKIPKVTIPTAAYPFLGTYTAYCSVSFYDEIDKAIIDKGIDISTGLYISDNTLLYVKGTTPKIDAGGVANIYSVKIVGLATALDDPLILNIIGSKSAPIMYTTGDGYTAVLYFGPPITGSPYSGIPNAEGGANQGGCLSSGTIITKSDGSFVNIYNINIGDELLSYDIDTKNTCVSKVEQIIRNSYHSYYIINNNLEITYEHPVYINRKDRWFYLPAKELKTGDFMLKNDLSKELITDIKYMNNDLPTWNFTVYPEHNFFANNYLVHNAPPYKP